MIKKLRMTKGWSQEQLAQISGLSVRTIQRIERGHKAGIESLKCLASVFEIDFTQLLSDSPKQEYQFLGANPVLPVKNVAETSDFYKNKLGFEIEVLWKEPPYSVVARDQTIIEFGEGRKEFAGTGVCMIFIQDIDSLYDEYSAKNVQFIGDVADRDYGSRDFRIKDNNGNVLILSSPLINQQALLIKGSPIANNRS